MQTLPSEEERLSNAVYEAMLWALSRPGQIRNLPEVGEKQIIDALIDRECRVYAAAPLLMPALLRTGAEFAELERADYAFLDGVSDLKLLEAIPQGTDLYPDDGATIFLKADLTSGTKLRLTGPGVDGTLEILVGGLPEGFWQKRARVMRYPMGFEIFLLDGERIMGLPRSTQVEEL